MKRFEKLAIAVVILWVIGWALSSATPYWISQVLTADEPGEKIKSFLVILLGSANLFKLLTSIVCGIFLYFEAKEEKKNKWVWCALGLVFKMNGILLFLAYLILGELRKRKTESAGGING